MPQRLSARDSSVIALLLVSAFVVILNETIMGVALPRLMADLHVTPTAGQWLTTAFMLTMAVVIPITGFLLQRLSTRRVFTLAMSFFSLGTLIAALAPGFAVLVCARVVQATGTAMMMPLLMTTVMTLVPAESRGKIMGNISIVISVAPAIGPVVSGAILSRFDWRWMFLFVLPIALAALVLGVLRVQNVSEARALPLDVVSVILSAFAFGGIVYGLSNLGEVAIEQGPVLGLVSLGVGLVSLAVFVARQRRLASSDRALLDVRTFRSRTFSVSVVMMAVSMMAMFGTIVLLPIYMQNVLGFSPLTTGLVLLPGGLMMGLLGPIVGRLYDRVGATPLLVPGATIVALAFWALSLQGTTSSFGVIVVVYLALCVGLGLMFTPLFTASLGSLEPRLYSHGSAIVGTVQQVAGAAGTALFVTIMSLRASGLTARGVDSVDALAAGMSLSFTVGALIAMAAIPIAFFVKGGGSGAGAGAPARSSEEAESPHLAGSTSRSEAGIALDSAN